MQGIQRGVVFTKAQMKWIETRAKDLGISISEVVRRTIDEKREAVTARSST